MRFDRLAIIFLSLLFVTQAVSQNPFDIKGRATSVDNAPQSVIIPKDATPDNQSEDLAIVESVSEASNIGSENYSSDNSNPFNVSHIPLRKSTFETRSMTEEQLRVEKSNFVSRNIPFFVILICLALLALVINAKDDAIKNAIRSSYNANFLKLIKIESLFGLKQSYALLYTSFALNLALALNHIFYKGDTKISSFLLILLAVATVYLLKHVWLYFFGRIFNQVEKFTSDYSFAVQIGNIVLGLVLFPFNIIMIYGMPSWVLGFGIVVFVLLVFSYLFRLSRGVLMSSKLLISSRFHFFLYLCACEFGPFLILTKILKGLV